MRPIFPVEFQFKKGHIVSPSVCHGKMYKGKMNIFECIGAKWEPNNEVMAEDLARNIVCHRVPTVVHGRGQIVVTLRNIVVNWHEVTTFGITFFSWSSQEGTGQTSLLLNVTFSCQ